MSNIEKFPTHPVSLIVKKESEEFELRVKKSPPNSSSAIQNSIQNPNKEDEMLDDNNTLNNNSNTDNSSNTTTPIIGNSTSGSDVPVVVIKGATDDDNINSNNNIENSTISCSTSIDDLASVTTTTTTINTLTQSQEIRDSEGKLIIGSLPISPTYESLLRSKKTKDCNLTVKVFEARSLLEARLRKKDSTKSSSKSFKRAQNLLTEISSPNLMTFSDTTDPYCVVALDKIKHRTRTIPKKLNPFWCEEFTMEITDPNAAKLIVNVMDEKKYSNDEHIGKLIIPINTLKDQKERELWYPLSAPSSKKNVPQIQIKFNFKPILLTDPSVPGSISWIISYGRNLSSQSQIVEDSGITTTPFINWTVRSKRGETIIDEEGISWQDALSNGVVREVRESVECITFVLWRYEPISKDIEGNNPTPNNSSYSSVTISPATSPLKNRSNSSSELIKSPDTKIRSSSVTNSTGGSASSPNKPPQPLSPPLSPSGSGNGSTPNSTRESLHLNTPPGMEQYIIGQGIVLATHIDTDKQCEQWLCLYPKPTAENKYGDVRLKIKYSEEVVLPLESYLNLLSHLQDERLFSIHLLAHVTKQREAVSHNLIRVFEKTGKCVFLLKTLTDHEIESTDNPDIIFRGNSLATKSVDLYMKLIGLPYLAQVLGPHIKKIYSSKKSCEIDPTKIEKGEDIKKNGKNLLSWVKKITQSILSSVNKCPGPLREVFRSIQSKVRDRYPKDDITRYTAVSGFIFLRFFCPAILAPKLFELMPDHPGIKTTRSLILIAKTLQNLANLVELGEHKEDFMKDMNRFVLDNMDNMKNFINQLSIVPENCPPGEVSNPIVLEKELACLYRHLIKQKDEMLEEINQIQDQDRLNILDAYQKLLKILDILEQEVIFTLSLN